MKGEKKLGRREQATANRLNAEAQGLLACRSHTHVFRSQGIGEERDTRYEVGRVKNQVPAGGRIHSEWWAPATLVRLNLGLAERGISSKLRTRVIARVAVGEPLPESDKILNAVADYTEEILLRK